MIHLDTTFLVDLLRESLQSHWGPAKQLVEDMADQQLAISIHAVCELHAGVELSSNPDRERQKVELLCSGLHIVHPDSHFPSTYGRLLAWLERQGQRIGVMDLLIGSAAVVAKAPLVTRNDRHFSRIPELKVISY